MNVKEAMIHYFDKIEALKENGDAAALIAGECVFFDKNDVLSYGKDFGNSRYPYGRDGLTVWANSSGNIVIEESTLHIAQDTCEGHEPRIAFFAGEAVSGGFMPISLTGVAKQLFEGDVKRYTVFTPYATYYLTESKSMRCAVRVFLDREKCVRFTVRIKNTTDKKIDTYLSSYFNLHLKNTPVEGEAKWYKRTAYGEGGFDVAVTQPFNRNLCVETFARIQRSDAVGVEFTTSHAEYCGGFNNQLLSAKSLMRGALDGCKPSTTFNETSVAADMRRIALNAGEEYEYSYTIAISGDPCEAKTRATRAKNTLEIDKILTEICECKAEIYKAIPDVSLEGVYGMDDEVLGYFINNVFKQTEFCTRAKNYAGAFIGIRDIFQQLEGALMWIPEYARGKIIEALNYISDDGRPPRQYSYPKSPLVPPEMDIRPFIDQGNWIITTVYEYLCFTDDLSILDEECGYYRIGRDSVDFSDRRDSVLCHLIAIADYLCSHVDEKTNCLHAMYGDWNDALDGLGRTKKADADYGNGVSVMATLHLYQNLAELSAILKKAGGDKTTIAKYSAMRDRISRGILEYAIEKGEGGARKVLHGWGEDISYKIGSFKDNDGECRDSLTSNAFFILSGAIGLDPTLKGDILAAYERLDSKYGLKTFEPYFAKTNTDVGRIVKLPRGTAENGATYIHATLFAIWSLFRIGEAKLAWEQIYKILPITHSFITTTPFVMPNSYIHNEEELLDGESMSDWFTGSGCVLTKVLVREVFGIEPTLDGINVCPAAYMPLERCHVTVRVKGIKLTINYENTGTGERTYTVNDKPCDSTYYDGARRATAISLSPDCDYVIDVKG